MGWYQRHLFFCTNRREDGRPCCQEAGAEPARAWAKARVKELGLSGPGKVRVNMAGCLDRCEEGPVAVVYPEGVWYTYVDQEDLEEIIQEHLVHGRVVERLQLSSEPPGGES
jgi:(2Fe-2S) ferredoxin